MASGLSCRHAHASSSATHSVRPPPLLPHNVNQTSQHTPPFSLTRAAAGVEGEPARPEAQLIPTSPRSVEACFRLGLDPLELAFKPLAAFKRPGEPTEMAQKRFEHQEHLRQVRRWVLAARVRHSSLLCWFMV